MQSISPVKVPVNKVASRLRYSSLDCYRLETSSSSPRRRVRMDSRGTKAHAQPRRASNWRSINMRLIAESSVDTSNGNPTSLLNSSSKKSNNPPHSRAGRSNPCKSRRSSRTTDLNTEPRQLKTHKPERTATHIYYAFIPVFPTD
jgi:hypothetical protein